MKQQVNREAGYHILCEQLTRNYATPVGRNSRSALAHANSASQGRFKVSVCFRI